jgi:hypothetical protein
MKYLIWCFTQDFRYCDLFDTELLTRSSHKSLVISTKPNRPVDFERPTFFCLTLHGLFTLIYVPYSSNTYEQEILNALIGSNVVAFAVQIHMSTFLILYMVWYLMIIRGQCALSELYLICVPSRKLDLLSTPCGSLSLNWYLQYRWRQLVSKSRSQLSTRIVRKPTQ